MAKEENCLKLWRAVLITTTVEPVGNVVGSEAQELHRLVHALHFLCYASDSAWSEGLLNVVTTNVLASVMCTNAWRKCLF